MKLMRGVQGEGVNYTSYLAVVWQRHITWSLVFLKTEQEYIKKMYCSLSSEQNLGNTFSSTVIHVANL